VDIQMAKEVREKDWTVFNNYSHPTVVEQDCPEISTTPRRCICKSAYVVWSHTYLSDKEEEE